MSESPKTVFGRLARLVIRQARWSAAAIAVVSLVGLLFAFRIDVDSDIVSLLPDDIPATRALHQLVEEGGWVATVTITVAGDDREAREAWVDRVGAELEALPEVRYAFHSVDPGLARRLGLLQIEPSLLGDLRDRLKGALALGSAVTNPFVAQRLLALGPLTERLQSASEKVRLDPAENMSRLYVRPTGQPTDIPFARQLMAKVDRVIEQNAPEEHGLRVVWIGGGYRHNVEDYEGILQDITRTSVAAVILVLLVISVAFRDFRAVLLIFGPLVVSNIWTLGFASATVGSLNTFTSFFTAVLVGLGIGFAVHLFSRYREERAGGGTLEQAVVRAWDKAGPPCFTAAATSAFGFMALFLARFRGFRQLGLLLGVGVLICLAAVMVVLPLLIRWRERATAPIPLRQVQPPVHTRPPTYRLAPLGLLLALLATLVAGLKITDLRFEYDISELRRDGLAYNDLDPLQQKLARDSYTPLVVTYPSVKALRQAYAQVTQEIESGELPEIAQALSVYTLIPQDQTERLAIIREIASLTEHENFKYLPAPVRENLGKLAGGSLQPLSPEDLPESLQDLLGAAGGQPRMLLLASGNMWDLRTTSHLNEVLEQRFPDVPVAGHFLCIGSLYDLMRDDAPRIIGMALVLVFIATMIHMRRLWRGLGAIGVLLAGMCWAGGAIAAFQIELSIVNIIGVPILLGIGVDVVIHLLHRLAEEGPGRILHALATTGWAAALATTTAVLSFTALVFAGTEGVRSLGHLVTAGLTMVTISAFVMLPLGWATAWKLSGDLPRHRSSR